MNRIRTYLLTIILGCLSLTSFSCDSDDDNNSYSSEDLYAILKPEGAQLIDIIPSDIVLTLNNIIAVNPETGEFKLNDVGRIDEIAIPLPTQHLICFYSRGNLLFEAKLNSMFSSYIPTGLTFNHMITTKTGLTLYVLSANRVISKDGKIIDGNPTEKQEKGMKQMYEILKKAGKLSNKIEYERDF